MVKPEHWVAMASVGVTGFVAAVNVTATTGMERWKKRQARMDKIGNHRVEWMTDLAHWATEVRLCLENHGDPYEQRSAAVTALNLNDLLALEQISSFDAALRAKIAMTGTRRMDRLIGLIEKKTTSVRRTAKDLRWQVVKNPDIPEQNPEKPTLTWDPRTVTDNADIAARAEKLEALSAECIGRIELLLQEIRLEVADPSPPPQREAGLTLRIKRRIRTDAGSPQSATTPRRR
ncbi:hypothetical protein [Melissospora conviva]|uniref:hypothetical protein n=2 Tax=Melissospora conviva TaxID=3388432 RepID=UPI003B807B2E